MALCRNGNESIKAGSLLKYKNQTIYHHDRIHDSSSSIPLCYSFTSLLLPICKVTEASLFAKGATSIGEESTAMLRQHLKNITQPREFGKFILFLSQPTYSTLTYLEIGEGETCYWSWSHLEIIWNWKQDEVILSFCMLGRKFSISDPCLDQFDLLFEMYTYREASCWTLIEKHRAEQETRTRDVYWIRADRVLDLSRGQGFKTYRYCVSLLLALDKEA